MQLVSQGQDGTFGQVIQLSFINQDTKYEVAPLRQQTLLEQEYKFVYPQDKESLEVLLLSLMREILKDKVLDQDQIQQLLHDVAAKLKGAS